MRSRTLREVMTQPVMRAHVDTPVREAAQRMAIANAGCVLVVDEGDHLVGVFTERDLLRMFTTRLDPPLTDSVAEHMSRYPLTMDPDASVEAARVFMKQNMIRHVPLVENGCLVGVVTMRDLPNR
jgi:CBS domain-containing protein